MKDKSFILRFLSLFRLRRNVSNSQERNGHRKWLIIIHSRPLLRGLTR